MIEPGQYLHWDMTAQKYPGRHERILSEVTQVDADIACFQEVEKALWDSWLLSSMQSMGYDGVHFISPHDLGVAVMWKRALFTCEHSEGHVSTDLAQEIIQVCYISAIFVIY